MEQDLPFPLWLIAPAFLVFFIGLWLTVTTVLGWISGWFRLQAAYPDSLEPPIERLRFQSGSMGRSVPANFNGCLTLEVCAGGLRVAMIRVLGPFSQPFFVPWSAIAVRRRPVLLGDMIELAFGGEPIGRLTLRQATAEKIAATGLLRLPA